MLWITKKPLECYTHITCLFSMRAITRKSRHWGSKCYENYKLQQYAVITSAKEVMWRLNILRIIIKSLGLSAGLAYTKKVTGGFGSNFHRRLDLAQHRGRKVVQFWWWSGSASRSRIAFSDFLTLLDGGRMFASRIAQNDASEFGSNFQGRLDLVEFRSG